MILPAVSFRIVALRKESVDRNSATRICKKVKNTSLSARRAWIEIVICPCKHGKMTVALRKESVDRNLICLYNVMMRMVALRKESVDRNLGFLGGVW